MDVHIHNYYYYIPSSNLLFCGYTVIAVVVYDETYSVIYGVIDDEIANIQGLTGAFLRLEISKYNYICRKLSNEYLKSCVTFSDKCG